MKIVIDASYPEQQPGTRKEGRGIEQINPVAEITAFLNDNGNQIRKAYNAQDPAEITGTSPAGANITCLVITEEIGAMNGGQQQPAGKKAATV